MVTRHQCPCVAPTGAAAGPVRFRVPQAPYAPWSRTWPTVDVVAGRGGGFSLKAPNGVCFLIRSRLGGS
ncbi:DUF779 domain-containing protein [Streptomyces lavendofoliae]|uniref:DUF779 domain-containing protein n=1 Tax=Streptomyces lavendofoliae TaxID=67314 RepID=UPI003D8CD1AD